MILLKHKVLQNSSKEMKKKDDETRQGQRQHIYDQLFT